MNSTRTTYRPVPLALTLLVATFSALVALALSGGHDAMAHRSTDHRAQTHAAAPGSVSAKELTFHDAMRKLWEDHVTWTRLAIVSLVSGAPDTNASVGRLLQNQADIGNALRPFYGAAAGNELTRLLRQHITIAADLVAAAKAGDTGRVAAAQAAWQRNADRIALFLNKANPHAWKLGELKSMFREHLRLTTNEAVARIQGKWRADVRDYDEIHVQILAMADMLAGGIVQQFPQRFL